MKVRLQEALNRLDAIDREVLSLPHLEQLTVAETARELGIKEKAAGKRYLRALEGLREVWNRFPEGLSDDSGG
jgi:RNA polymerase sigma-70 factor (ECF subfamily)